MSSAGRHSSHGPGLCRLSRRGGCRPRSLQSGLFRRGRLRFPIDLLIWDSTGKWQKVKGTYHCVIAFDRFWRRIRSKRRFNSPYWFILLGSTADEWGDPETWMLYVPSHGINRRPSEVCHKRLQEVSLEEEQRLPDVTDLGARLVFLWHALPVLDLVTPHYLGPVSSIIRTIVHMA